MSVTSLKTVFNQVAETVVKAVKVARLFADNKITIMRHLPSATVMSARKAEKQAGRILQEIMKTALDITTPAAQPIPAVAPISARTPTYK